MRSIVLKNHFKEGTIEAGCDEAGRGCLAGPVFAAAVILPEEFYHPLLNDSKQVSPGNRNILRRVIEKSAISFSVASIPNKEIDKINILNASILAMHKALEKLMLNPSHILVDGNRFKNFKHIPHSCIVKGDSIFASIAAASILAKTYRDEYMNSIHKEYPMYAWDRNKGYPTLEHRKAVQKYGLSKYHRKSFHVELLQPTLNLQPI